MSTASIRLLHPVAASQLADIIEMLLERVDNYHVYIPESVAHAQHDLDVLEQAGLYRPGPALVRRDMEAAEHEI